jgi:hypothetical protein
MINDGITENGVKIMTDTRSAGSMFPLKALLHFSALRFELGSLLALRISIFTC